MTYTRREIEQFVEEEDVKFIRLAFVDVFGRQKNLSIMRSELQRAFDYGVPFDASRIAGFEDDDFSELILRPEMETIAVLPWRPDRGRVVRMFCSIERPDGAPFEADSRAILKKAVSDAGERGISFEIGSEMEFYLFQLDEHGEATKIPLDAARYMDVSPLDKGENFRRQVCLTLEQMGIQPESSHHEEGFGQNEIDYCTFDPLAAADAAITLRFVVSTIAMANGLFADFSPKPVDGQPGNGMRVVVTMRLNNQKNLMPRVLAGLLDHIYESTLFYNPTEDSYRRFGSDAELMESSWSGHKRSQLARISSLNNNRDRTELRSPDSTCNPYIAYALIIWSALDGIDRELSLPLSARSSNTTPAANARRFILPQTLEEAQDAARTSEFIATHLPQRVVRRFLDSKERRN